MKNDDKLKNIKKSLLSVMRESRRWLLVVGTGASVAMDAELGMPALKNHLLVPGTIPEDIDGWKPVAEKLKKCIDLETALTEIPLTESLQNEIARHTADFVAQKDAALRDKVLTGKKTWVVEPLLQQLMRGLSPTWPRLPIVTPNYDMLIEYACSKANIPCITGYHGGIIRRQDWLKANELLYRLTTVTMGGKRRKTITPIPRQTYEGSRVDQSFSLQSVWNFCRERYLDSALPIRLYADDRASRRHKKLWSAHFS